MEPTRAPMFCARDQTDPCLVARTHVRSKLDFAGINTMLKSQVTSQALQSNLAQHMSESARRNSHSTTSMALYHKHSDAVNFISFNQDLTCVAVGTSSGYRIFNCKPSFRKAYQFKKNEAIGIVEMLYLTLLLAIVGLGEATGSLPRKLRIINIKTLLTICDLVFPSTILQVKLTRSRLIVLLEEQIYIYDITNMNFLHTIETSPNAGGLCSISNESCLANNYSFLAYPSPPKTITHESLLVNGVNTNGGANSVQNNIQLVSASPNRVGDVIIFDLELLQPISVIEAHKLALAAIALSKDGSLLATASDKGTIVRVFSVETGVKLYQFRRGTYLTKIYSLSILSDNKYVVATSSSETVHIFRLGEEESLENKQRRKRDLKKTKLRKDPEYAPIAEENEADLAREDEEDDDDVIADDGDDSDADDEDDDDDAKDTESLEVISSKSRKLSQSSTNLYASISLNISNEEGSPQQPIVDTLRLSVARLIRRSSQTLGRKAAQKMGDFLPSRFSSILEPTRHFASLKINVIGKDVKSIAVMSNEVLSDVVPPFFAKEMNSPRQRDDVTMNLIHINVVTSEGLFYTYGLDPERGGDCILLHQYSLLEDGA